MMMFGKRKAALAAAVAAWIASAPLTVYAETQIFNGETISSFYAYKSVNEEGIDMSDYHIVVNDINFNAPRFILLQNSGDKDFGNLTNNTITINDGSFKLLSIYTVFNLGSGDPVVSGSGNDITINGGTFVKRDNESSFDIKTYYGDININGGSFNKIGLLYAKNGDVNITDGNFDFLNGNNRSRFYTTDGNINISGGVFGTDEDLASAVNLANSGKFVTFEVLNADGENRHINSENAIFKAPLQVTLSQNTSYDTPYHGTMSFKNSSFAYLDVAVANTHINDLVSFDTVTGKIRSMHDSAKIDIVDSEIEGYLSSREISIKDSTITSLTQYDMLASDKITLDNSNVTGKTRVNSAGEINITNGTTYTGDIQYRGKTMNITDSEVVGNITTNTYKEYGTDASANIDNSTITGDLILNWSSRDANEGNFLIKDSTINGDVNAIKSRTVKDNVINIQNTTLNGDFTALIEMSTVDNIKDNVVTIDADSTINGNLYLLDSSRDDNNVLNLYTMQGLDSDTVISGNKRSWSYSESGVGNTLNVKNVLGATAKNIEHWKNINIYVPATVAAGDTVLTLTDANGTDLSGTTVKAGIEGDIDFNTGDKIFLLTNANGITTDAATSYGTLTSGVSTIYTGLTVKKDGDNSVILTIPAAPAPDPDLDPPQPDPDPDPPAPNPAPLPPVIPINPPVMKRINPETQSLLSGQVAATEIIEEAVELADAIRDAEIGDGIFGVISGAAVKNNDVSSKNTHFVAGYKRADEERIAAAYVQYGRGSYDSDIQHISASGNNDYIGIGGYYKQALPSDAYVDAGLNVGQVSRDYAGHGFSTVIDTASYEKEKTPYVGGFVRLGKEWSIFREDPDDTDPLFIEEKARYGAYLKVSAAHIGGFDTKLSSGERYSFDDTLKTGVTVGATYEQQIDAKSRISADLGVTQGFGKAGASFRHGDIESVDLNGISAALSVAWKQEIDDRQSVDLRVRGIAGARSGGDIAVTYNMIF